MCAIRSSCGSEAVPAGATQARLALILRPVQLRRRLSGGCKNSIFCPPILQAAEVAAMQLGIKGDLRARPQDGRFASRSHQDSYHSHRAICSLHD